MVTQYDEKGKIFTQVVAKHPIPVTIQTSDQVIHGLIHVRAGQRIKDELNGDERFLAVTEAIIFDRQNNELYRTSFLVINVDHVVWVLPKDEMPR